MHVGLPTIHRNGDLDGSMYASQPPETVEQSGNTKPDDLMNTGGQSLTGAATKNHLDTETANDQVLELTIPQDDMDQFCEDPSETSVGIPAMGDLRDRTNPSRFTPTGVKPVTDDVAMTEDTPSEPNAPCKTEVVSKTVRIESQDDMEAQVPSPQNKEPSWKVWKICIKCGKKGHVTETCPNGNKNEVLNLNAAQIYHLGQNNNCNDKNTTWIKGTNMDQLMESFHSLRATRGSNSTTMAPMSLNHAMQPPEGPKSAKSEAEKALPIT